MKSKYSGIGIIAHADHSTVLSASLALSVMHKEIGVVEIADQQQTFAPQPTVFKISPLYSMPSPQYPQSRRERRAAERNAKKNKSINKLK